MSDVNHEIKSISAVVDAPLSSKVEKFNKKAEVHKTTQKANPFSGHAEPTTSKPEVSGDEYGRPKKGSLTEYRGQKASTHIYKEMLELCSIIHEEGEPVKDNPELRVISFGDLFQIYTNISNKVCGILLRSRKQGLLTFEGEMLFQKFHDHVPIRTLFSQKDIEKKMKQQIREINQNLCKDPKATTLLK